VLTRITSLAIPPAWKDVWICPSPRGHIQATGRDARGRKQYRYHEDFRRARDETKFHRVIAFAAALPKIRARVDEDLRRKRNDRDKVLATVVRLLEASLIRIGHEEYRRKNGSYGLTTMTTRHVDVRGSAIRFHFRAKSGLMRDVDVHDRELARVLASIKLFQYEEDGALRTVLADDVNDYIRRIAGEDFSAKDFRTWAGTVHAAMALAEAGDVKAAIAETAKRLGNTPAVCKSCYVHPDVIAAFFDGTLAAALEHRGKSLLSRHEAAVALLLEKRATKKTA
jgi:DNA topoisomerase-1